MNYGYLAAVAAGLLLSARAERANHGGLPSFPGVVEVGSSLPGRLRLYVPALRERAEAAADMKKRMEDTGAVRRVELNPVTGSVLILYDESQVEPAVVEGAAIRLLGLEEEIEKQPVSRMEKGIRSLTESVNHALMETTGGWMDLRMLAGTAMTVTAARSILSGAAGMPGAITLLWWASGLFGRNRRD